MKTMSDFTPPDLTKLFESYGYCQTKETKYDHTDYDY
jgi:hypothetical protein